MAVLILLILGNCCALAATFVALRVLVRMMKVSDVNV